MADSAGMKKKIGPLPLWTWAILGGVAVYYLYRRMRENAAATTSSSTSTLDPNAVDPNTGLTYGAEENAALQYGSTSALGGGSTSSGASPQPLDIGAEITDITNLISGLEAAGLISSPTTTNAGSQGPAGPAGPAGPPGPAGPSAPVSTTPNTPGSASSPSAPTTTNKSTQPATVGVASLQSLQQQLLTKQGIAGGSALSFLKGLLAGGSPYHKLANTTQKGGLPQTGTYVRAGSPTYFVWGTSTTGYHVRQAT